MQLIDHVANATLLLPSDAVGSVDEETLLAATYQSKSVQDVLNETIVSIRENLRLSQILRLHLVNSDSSDGNNNLGRLVGYVHGRVDVNYEAGTAAAIVQVQPLKPTSDVHQWEPQWQEAGKKLAMHIVAAKPLYLRPNAVPADALEKERVILAKQVRFISQITKWISFSSFRRYCSKMCFVCCNSRLCLSWKTPRSPQMLLTR